MSGPSSRLKRAQTVGPSQPCSELSCRSRHTSLGFCSRREGPVHHVFHEKGRWSRLSPLFSFLVRCEFSSREETSLRRPRSLCLGLISFICLFSRWWKNPSRKMLRQLLPQDSGRLPSYIGLFNTLLPRFLSK